MPVNPYVKGGSADVPIVEGGTGASTAPDARTNLGALDTASHALIDHTGITGVGDLTVASHATTDHSTVPMSYRNIGTATDAVAAGDFAAGDGTNQIFWDASAGTLTASNGLSVISAGATDILFTTNAIERVRFTNAGTVAIGDGSQSDLSGTTYSLVSYRTGSNIAIQIAFSNTSATAPGYYLSRSRGTSGALAAVQSGDTLGTLFFQGSAASGATYIARNAASISAVAAENYSTSTSASHLIFSTTPTTTTNPVERMRIISDGQVRIGSGSATDNLSGSWPGEWLRVTGAGANARITLRASGTGSEFSTVMLQRARGSFGAETALLSGDALGQVTFWGSQTANSYLPGAAIGATADANWVNGSSLPTRLTFTTVASGSTTQVERVRITSDGRLMVGSSSFVGINTPSNGAYKFNVGQDATTVAAVYASGVGSVPAFGTLQSRGTTASPTNTQNGDVIGRWNFAGRATGTYIEGVGVDAVAGANWGAAGTETAYLVIRTANAGTSSERARITSAGVMVVGDTTTTTQLTSYPAIYVATTGNVAAVASRAAADNATFYGGFFGQRSRGTNVAPSALQSGDLAAQFVGQGYIGATTGFASLAAIGIGLDGAPVDGSASPGHIRFQTAGATGLSVAERWRITSGGHLLAWTDNTYDIGATGATRPRRVYVGTEVVVGNTVTIGTASIAGSGALALDAAGGQNLWIGGVNGTQSIQIGYGTNSFYATPGGFVLDTSPSQAATDATYIYGASSDGNFPGANMNIGAGYGHATNNQRGGTTLIEGGSASGADDSNGGAGQLWLFGGSGGDNASGAIVHLAGGSASNAALNAGDTYVRGGEHTADASRHGRVLVGDLSSREVLIGNTASATQTINVLTGGTLGLRGGAGGTFIGVNATNYWSIDASSNGTLATGQDGSLNLSAGLGGVNLITQDVSDDYAGGVSIYAGSALAGSAPGTASGGWLDFQAGSCTGGQGEGGWIQIGAGSGRSAQGGFFQMWAGTCTTGSGDGGFFQIDAGDGGTGGGSGGYLGLFAGDARGGTDNGGDVTIDAGSSVGGTAGVIDIGLTKASAVNIGKAGGTVNIAGSVPSASLGSASTGADGLIQVKPGFTSIGDGALAAGLTFGPVYYDVKNGNYVSIGNSVYIDGSGVNNIIRAGDGGDLDVATPHTVATSGNTYDVSTAGAIAATALQPGSVTVRVILNGGSTFTTVTDDGAGTFAAGAVFPLGGTVDYANRTLTGVTAGLRAESRVEIAFATANTAGEALSVRAGDGNGTAIGGNLVLRSGAGSTSGNLIVDVGAGASANGTLTIGNTNAESVTIGRSTKTTNVAGYFTVGTQPVPAVLSVTSVDLATVATTNLYTVPTGRSLVVTDVFLKATTATAANGDAVGGVGVAAGEDDIVASQTLTGLSATTEAFRMTHGGTFYVAVAADVVKFGVDTADTGTALVADVYLVGYLI